MRSFSQLLLLFLLNFIVLCFGQQTPVDGTQYEYYTPKDEKDIWDSKLNGFVQKNGDQWKFDLKTTPSNEPLNIVLFMDQNHSMEFTLDAEDLNAIGTNSEYNRIFLSLENDAKEVKKIMVQWQSQTLWGKKSVIMKVFINTTYVDVGELDPSKNEKPKFVIDYEGKVTAEFVGAKPSQESKERLLLNGQSSANFTVSITWTNLESSFTISFPSSIFRARRPLPPPSKTSTSAPFGSSTESTAEIELWIIIVPCVVGVLIILGVAIGIGYYCHRKKAKKNKPPPAPPSDATPVDIKLVPSNEVQKSVVPTMVNAPELPSPTKN